MVSALLGLVLAGWGPASGLLPHVVPPSPAHATATATTTKIWTRSSFAQQAKQTTTTTSPASPELTAAASSARVSLWTSVTVVLGTAALGVSKTLRKEKEQQQQQLDDDEDEDDQSTTSNTAVQDELERLSTAADSFRLPLQMQQAVESTPMEKDADDSVLVNVAGSSLKPGEVFLATESEIVSSTTVTKTHQSLPLPLLSHSQQHQLRRQRHQYNTLPPYYKSNMIKARQQPKSRWTEAKLQARYAAIESIEERAFQILVDLGMVALHDILTEEETLILTTTTTQHKNANEDFTAAEQGNDRVLVQ